MEMIRFYIFMGWDKKQEGVSGDWKLTGPIDEKDLLVGWEEMRRPGCSIANNKMQQPPKYKSIFQDWRQELLLEKDEFMSWKWPQKGKTAALTNCRIPGKPYDTHQHDIIFNGTDFVFWKL